MAYADHSQGSSRTVSIVIVALIHAVLGYAFVTGLGYQYIKKAAEKLNVVDVKEPPPPKEEPPPPPPDQPIPPPPVVTPPPIVNVPVSAPPQVISVPTPPPISIPTPAPAPPPPPVAKQAAKAATPRGRPQDWATTDDYPPRALREERAGNTGFRVTIGPDGRPTGCTVSSSSGSPDLDDATCKLVMRRARFNPAEDDQGNKIAGSFASRITWRIPD